MVRWLSRSGGGVHTQRVIVIGFLRRVGQDGPRIADEPESIISVGDTVPFRVEEECKPPVLGGDEVEAVSQRGELQDGVPVVLVSDSPGLAGYKGIGHGDYLVSELDPDTRVGVTRPDREGLGTVQVTCDEEPLRYAHPPRRLSPVVIRVHFRLDTRTHAQRVSLSLSPSL